MRRGEEARGPDLAGDDRGRGEVAWIWSAASGRGGEQAAVWGEEKRRRGGGGLDLAGGDRR